ncbi:MAG: hypothetical protein NVSMB64_12410 [Candidatus Velthaea sp.]
MSFNIDDFAAECRSALAADSPQKNVQAVVSRAVADAASVVKALGVPQRAQIAPLYCAPDLTILNVVWAPKMTLLPHNHAMWAIIGIYGGREDNIFWKRIPGSEAGAIEAAGARSIGDRDSVILGTDIIHSVTNPTPRLTGAIHVYGGDFFHAKRSEWDPETLREGPFDAERNSRRFEEENLRWPLPQAPNAVAR